MTWSFLVFNSLHFTQVMSIHLILAAKDINFRCYLCVWLRVYFGGIHNFLRHLESKWDIYLVGVHKVIPPYVADTLFQDCSGRVCLYRR